jgi:hypothetical protein
VCFTDDRLADLALWGRSAADECTLPSPELTNIGSFEKGWRRLNGRWWLEKQATPGEQLAELFAFHLGRALGLSMAEYKTGEGTVLTPDFTNGANLEHAFAFMGENEDYADTLAVLKNLCPAAIPDYIRMIFLDALIANPDRHTFNFGLMRDRSTGMLTGLAPLFDHNMALAGGGHTLAGMCIDLLEQYPAGREFLPAVSEETVLHALENTGLPCDRTAVLRSVMERYRLICPAH